jgi:predicted signal transduction protein with EAL and GGDEF domain
VEDAEALAQRFIQVVDQPFDIDGQQTYVGISIGIALSSAGIAPEELVKQADMALYDAKEGGRGGYRCFAPEMDAKLCERRALENDLRAAFANQQLHLFYQPQVDLNSLEVIGCEALMRWNRPGHGAVSPSQFIPLAEAIGLIGPLGAWLLREACRQATRWPARMHVAVNVSPVQLRLPGFLEAVADALATTGLAPARLELEVTEGVLLRDTAETLATFAALRGIGVRLALDDFGTGYASLAYLLQFRFDKIKIDRSFVSGLGTDPNASAIVRAVIGLCTALDMRIVAEGVEDDEAVATLRALGCGVAQGFRFFRPMPAETMERLANAAPAADLPALETAAA